MNSLIHASIFEGTHVSMKLYLNLGELSSRDVINSICLFIYGKEKNIGFLSDAGID